MNVQILALDKIIYNKRNYLIKRSYSAQEVNLNDKSKAILLK